MRRIRLAPLAGVLALLMVLAVTAVRAEVGLQPVTTVESATYLWHAGDSRLFIVERAGRVLIHEPGQGTLPTPFLDIRSLVAVGGERGLYAIAFHPDFATNRYFYVSYAGNQPLVGVILARYQVSASDPDVADPNSGVIVYAAPHPSGAHNGGQIAIRPGEQHLYFSLGDGGSSNDPPCNAQNGQVPLGKILRLDVTQNLETPPYYAVPADNPFVGAADPTDEYLDEIWALGLRNPYRFSFDTLGGDLFIGDVGQDGREEHDFHAAGSPSGLNYGWKVMEGTLCQNPAAGNCPLGTPPCFDPAYTPPIHEVPHSEGGTCAAIGGFRYRGSALPELTGKYVFGDLCSGRIWSIEELLPGVWGNRQLLVEDERFLQSFGQDSAGELYAIYASGNVARLVPGASVSQPASPGQQLCVNTMNRRGSDVLATRGRSDAECVRLAGRGLQDADVCLLAAPGVPVQRRIDQLVAQEAMKCRVAGKPELVPDFGFTSSGRVAGTAKAISLGFTRSLFGAAVQDAIVLASQDAAGARCQAAVAKSAHGLLSTLWKAGLEGKRGHLNGRLGPAVVSAPELGDRVLTYVDAGSASGRVAARRAQLERQVDTSCDGQPLGQLFPGTCNAASGAGAFTDCVMERARCHFCRSLEGFDGLSLDCDGFDDGASNASCPSQADLLCSVPGAGVNFDAAVVDCPQLQDYRLFGDPADPRAGANGGTPFDLTTPLFSDYAIKYRFVFLPPGTQAVYHASDPFEFPVGTIIAKSFSTAHDLRDPGLGDDLVETRLLIHREFGWEGLTYVWDAGSGEANLSNSGADVPVSWIHSDGSPRSTTYRIPTPTECGDCHDRAAVPGDAPIGPKARLLNRSFDYGGGPINQLDHWTAIGLLAGAPPSGSAPRLPFWDDPADGTLEQRAFAYLESNCAHCHNPEGKAGFTGLDLRHDVPVGPSRGVCQPSGFAGIPTLVHNIVPGEPAESILSLRLGSTSDGIRMPPLLKSVAHDEGVGLIDAWIATLPGTCP